MTRDDSDATVNMDLGYNNMIAEVVTGPSYGMTLNKNGSFTTTPTPADDDSFTYRAGDGLLWSDPVTVTSINRHRPWISLARAPILLYDSSLAEAVVGLDLADLTVSNANSLLTERMQQTVGGCFTPTTPSIVTVSYPKRRSPMPQATIILRRVSEIDARTTQSIGFPALSNITYGDGTPDC